MNYAMSIGAAPVEDDSGLPRDPASEIESDPVFYEQDEPRHAPRQLRLIPALLGLLLVAWTGFFVYASVIRLTGAPDLPAVAAMVSGWAIPVLAIGMLWLILVRGRSVEAIRFGRVAEQLDEQSAALEIRLGAVNGELALARELLEGESRALESLGRQSAERLTASAFDLRAAMAESEERAQRLEEVSTAAANNLEHLRKQLPVVINAAKDVTNQIANAGNTAQQHMNSMIGSLKQVGENGRTVRDQVAELEADTRVATSRLLTDVEAAMERLDGARGALAESMRASFIEADSQGQAFVDRVGARFETLAAEMDSRVAASTDSYASSADAVAAKLADGVAQLGDHSASAVQLLDTTSARLDARADEMLARVRTASGELGTAQEQAAQALSYRLAVLERAIAGIGSKREAEAAALTALTERLETYLVATGERIATLDRDGTARTEKLAGALDTLLGDSRMLADTLEANAGRADALIERTGRIPETAEAGRIALSEALPAAVEALEARLSANRAEAERLAALLATVDASGGAIAERMLALDEGMQRQSESFAALHTDGAGEIAARANELDALREAVGLTRSEFRTLATGIEHLLTEKLSDLRVQAGEVGDAARSAIDESILLGANALAGESSVALAGALDDVVRAMRERLAADVAGISASVEKSLGGVTQQIERLEGMTRALEARLADADRRFESTADESFARRMGLLTESLNSTAIDVAKILSNEVTDTAWSAYLKGDRGVFARRAVRLLDAGEARLIAQHYEEDADFREHVNRYIHDFESMMRNLLSTRDGHAISVTLLSSDVGKLYVALAQAIERLRT